ncbi:MAG TPA: Nramp family divalent metal transporter [Gemmataceae bacterium]|jgi:NRAMP (natural resistance-associated macrophage protein)-like metal ion transporter|nr:Nramp family divalent metal transporter [Gemmataceae bacterium]
MVAPRRLDDADSGVGQLPADVNGDRKKTPATLLSRILSLIGPGIITGASDDDPSGIGTYSMAGAALGYSILWSAWITFPLMAAVQFICAKVGLASGEGLAGALRRHYSRKLLLAVVLGLLIANTINAGADIFAIAAGFNLLFPVRTTALILPVAIIIVVLQVWGSYRVIANVFKWLCLSLFAYIASSFLAHPEWGRVARGTLLPSIHFDRTFLSILVAVLGTTISPYLFFWQASQEVEEKRAEGRKWLWQRRGASDRNVRFRAWDVIVGMLFSNVVMFFIMLASAATLNRAGRTDIGSAEEAAEVLRPLAGNAATILMALGLIGTGLLAVPILTGSAAYAVCETFRWPCSLDAKPHKAKEFYLVVAASTLGGLLIDFLGVSPMKALFWTAVINGFLAPPLLVLVMLIANNKAVMGKRVNGLTLNILGWATAVLMFVAAIGLVLTW